MNSNFIAKRRTWILVAIGLVSAVCIAAFLFPDMAERWLRYNARMLRNIAQRAFPYVLIQLGLAAFVFLLEVVVIGWQKSSLRRLMHPDKSMRSDIYIFLVNIFQIDYAVIFLLTLGVIHKLELGIKTAIDLDQGLLATMIPNPTLQLAIYILLADFLQFLQHYIHHKVSFVWPFHSYHHSATELNILTGNRGHPVQVEFTNALITVLPLTLAGVPLVSLLAFRLLRNTLAYMHHSHLPWGWGWIGKYLIVSPAFHRIHHSVLPEHYDKNLAVLFPLWDHLFGTYYKGSTPPGEFGIPDSQFNKKGFLDDMLVPFRMLRKKGEG